MEQVKNPHIVANYLKRLLREMKSPLIPFHLYEDFGNLNDKDNDDERFIEIKRLVGLLSEQRKNVLKFLLEFFLEVVSHENENKMTTYNIAVTVGPNIFRP